MKWSSIIAWFGLFLIILFMVYASVCLHEMIDPNSWWQGRLQSVDVFPILLLFSAIGLPFILIGGLIGKPRFFWLATIIIGSIYLILIIIYKITALSFAIHGGPSYITLLFVGIPAYINISEGMYLKLNQGK